MIPNEVRCYFGVIYIIYYIYCTHRNKNAIKERDCFPCFASIFSNNTRNLQGKKTNKNLVEVRIPLSNFQHREQRSANRRGRSISVHNRTFHNNKSVKNSENLKNSTTNAAIPFQSVKFNLLRLDSNSDIREHFNTAYIAVGARVILLCVVVSRPFVIIFYDGKTQHT